MLYAFGMSDLRDQHQGSTGTRYSDETKEIAYQLWAFATARNASEVARQLKTEEWGHLDVPRETVAYWAREYEWSKRADADVHSIAPNLRYQTFAELLFAGHDGARYIRRVVRGDEDVPFIGDLLEDDTLDEKSRSFRIDIRLKSHDAARKAKLSAAIAAVDRIGFSPVGKSTPDAELPKPKSDTQSIPDLAGKSPDELMRLEQEHRSRRAPSAR